MVARHLYTLGRLKRIEDPLGKATLFEYEVDKLGRTTKTFAKYIPGGDRRLDYAYDARGDLVTFTLNEPNEALAHVYTYAADSGRIATALFPGESTALVIARWPHDGVKSIDYPGGVRREVDYDVRGPVSEIRIKPPSGTPLIEKWTYTYTDVLNVATMTDGASRQTTYQYDALDRLTQADHPAMPAPLNSLPDVENFTYDGVGNRTMTGYAHDANHRMRESPGHTYDYDEDGNLASRDPNTPSQVSYSWNTSDHLSGHADTGGVTSIQYDHSARRIRSSASGAATYSLWSGRAELGIYNSSGIRVTRRSHLRAAAPDQVAYGASLAVEGRAFLQGDSLDTPLLAHDTTGTTTWIARYAAYGEIHSDPDPDGNSQPTLIANRRPGQIDTTLELYYNQHRYYSPQVGRYVSADPLGLVAGLNLYQYVRSSPVNGSDLLGLFPPGNMHPSVLRDFCKNLARAAEWGGWPLGLGAIRFAWAVQTGGEWDYKAQADEADQTDPDKYQDSGNYHFGAVARAAGFGREQSLYWAGAAQVFSDVADYSIDWTEYLGGSSNDLPQWPAGRGYPGGGPPYGDEPRDQFWILEGYRDYNKLLKACDSCDSQ